VIQQSGAGGTLADQSNSEQNFHSLQMQDTYAPQLYRQKQHQTGTQKTTSRSGKVSTHTSVKNLERVGDAWHLTLEGITEAWAAGVYLWPSGPPAGVRIVPLVVTEEPVQMGLFELTGVTYDAIDTMESSFAKWFFDLGLRPVLHPLRTIRLWFKAFIPQAILSGPPGKDCFMGDNRSYSSDPMASARMTSEVVFENLDTPEPMFSQSHRCGLTRQVDCGWWFLGGGTLGAPIHSATADTRNMRFYNFQKPGVQWDWPYPYPPAAHPPERTVEAYTLSYEGRASDPLVPFAPDINIWAYIQLDLNSGLLSVNGMVDDFPAFEGYVTVNETQGPFGLFALDGEDWVLSLVGPANRPFNNTISLGSSVAMTTKP